MPRWKQRRSKRRHFTGLCVFPKPHSAHATFGAVLALDGTAQRRATQTANGKRTFLKRAQEATEGTEKESRSWLFLLP